MSTTIHLSNHQELDLTWLKDFLKKHHLFFGVYNQNYCLDTYKGNEDITNTYFVIENKERYARGIHFYLHSNYEIELTLSTPTSTYNIEFYYRFIDLLCRELNQSYFYIDTKEFTLDQIKELKEKEISLNKQFIKRFLKEDTTLFGSIYPICLEKECIDQLKDLDKEEASLFFENYLDTKQRMNLDFAGPLLYTTKEEKRYIGKYALSKDVPTIFPITPYLPYSYDQELFPFIKEWSILILDGTKVLGELPFKLIWNVFDLQTCPRFDSRHVIITLKDEHL